MTVESQDLWGRMWKPKPPHNSTNMIINIKYGYGGGDEGIRTLETLPGLLP